MYKRKLRTALTILGIAFGVALIFGVSTTKTSTLHSFIGLIDNLGGKSELIVNNTSSTGFKRNIAYKISRVEGVKEAVPSISTGVFLLVNDKKESLEFLGVDPLVDKRIRKYDLASGRYLKNTDESALLLNADFAKQKNLNINDEVQLIGSKGLEKFKIVGLLKSTGVGQAARGFVTVSTIAAGQKLLSFKEKVNKVDVITTNKNEVGKVGRRLEKALGSGYEAKRPFSRGKSISSSLDFLIASFNFFSFIVLMAGGFLILNTLRMSVQERQGQIGTLRALGSSRAQILGMVLLESLTVGIAGVSLGIVLGWFISFSMIGAFVAIYQTNVIEVTFSVKTMISSVVIGLVVSTLAGLLPAIRASRISPISSITQSKRAHLSWFEKNGGLLGVVMLIIAGLIYLRSSTTDSFTLAGLLVFSSAIFIAPLFVSIGSFILQPVFKIAGTEGIMAIRNFVRTKSRSQAAVAAIMSSLVLTLMIGELGLSQDRVINRFVDQIFYYDLVLGNTPYSLIDINKYPPLPKSIIEDVKDVKGVGPVHYAKFLPVKVGNKRYYGTFVSGRPKGMNQFREGNPYKAFKDINKGDYVIIATTVSSNLKKHKGDFLRVKTSKGWRNFKISGTYVDLANNGESITLGRYSLKKYFGEEGIDLIELSAKKGYQVSSLQQRLIENIGKPRGILVSLASKQRDDILKVGEQFSAAQRSLIVLAIMVSTLGIINILVMNVMERRREIGILRAVGLVKGQLRKTVVLEALAIGLVGTMLGIVFGLVMARTLIFMANNLSDYGYDFIFPQQDILIALFIALGVSLAASVYPANKAAKTRIVEALRYE